MFALRRITKEQVEMNFDLGNEYTLIEEAINKGEFDRNYEHTFGTGKPEKLKDGEDNVYAFVSNQDGSRCYPIYKGEYNFIMTESGRTFAKI